MQKEKNSEGHRRGEQLEKISLENQHREDTAFSGSKNEERGVGRERKKKKKDDEDGGEEGDEPPPAPQSHQHRNALFAWSPLRPPKGYFGEWAVISSARLAVCKLQTSDPKQPVPQLSRCYGRQGHWDGTVSQGRRCAGA